MYNLERLRSHVIALRKIALLTTWLYAWLRWPNHQPELITAASGALFLYVTLQVSITSGKLGHR
jgi:hypothetical protein